jgi:hypothetical protein
MAGYLAQVEGNESGYLVTAFNPALEGQLNELAASLGIARLSVEPTGSGSTSSLATAEAVGEARSFTISRSRNWSFCRGADPRTGWYSQLPPSSTFVW